MKKIKKINYLYAAFVAELLLIFYLRNDAGYILSPVLLLTAGLFLSVYPYFIYRKTPETFKPFIINPAKSGKKQAWFLFGIFSLVYFGWSMVLFYKYPVDINQSDIIPFIEEVYLKRFMKGIPVYSQYTGFSYGTFTPGYLPFHWGPLLIPFLLNMDPRWICVVFFILATAIYTKQIVSHSEGRNLLVKVSLPFILIFSIYLKQGKDVSQTIEIMVVAYYLFLSVSFFQSNTFIKAAGIVFPLLSRYSFIFWLPSYAFVLIKKNWKSFTNVFMFGCLLMGFFLLPFIIQTPSMPGSLNANYINGVIGEWQGQSWQKPGDKPFQLFQGPGFASWFYEFFSGTLIEKINSLKFFLLTLSLALGVFHIIIYQKISKYFDADLFALLSLKASLSIFYAFILVPYIYLNWVPLIVSVVILSRIKKTEQIH